MHMSAQTADPASPAGESPDSADRGSGSQSADTRSADPPTPRPSQDKHDRSPRAVRLVCHVLRHTYTKLHEKSRWTFYEEAAAESPSGLPRGGQRHMLLVWKRMRKERGGVKAKGWRREGDVRRGPSNSCYCTWTRNPKNACSHLNSGQMLR